MANKFKNGNIVKYKNNFCRVLEHAKIPDEFTPGTFKSFKDAPIYYTLVNQNAEEATNIHEDDIERVSISLNNLKFLFSKYGSRFEIECDPPITNSEYPKREIYFTMEMDQDGMWKIRTRNDLPEKYYDFQTDLGDFINEYLDGSY